MLRMGMRISSGGIRARVEELFDARADLWLMNGWPLINLMKRVIVRMTCGWTDLLESEEKEEEKV